MKAIYRNLNLVPKLILFVLLLTGLVSCKSKNAIDFKREIVRKEKSTMDELLRKGGPQEEKLKYLMQKDFRNAMLTADKQEQVFNTVIKQITTLPADGIKQGKEVKAAATAYYTSMKDLYGFDRKEISQMEITYSKDTEKVKIAQDSLLSLNKEKLNLFENIRKKNEVLQHNLELFDKANNL
ncbi:hypothetical protein [Pedobacter cryoconitis]|uniref:Lipoprotein n=1 Tax=Pedobacter cryoconitis TaxID=188932 RepID=A0A7X0MGX5_9SPHI|nr:hypothetical protein [Pedobacter cryoconitis]MBB6498812.1 hypothetical protein [Pedobacter cryoconitis]